jgi:hypothetical protein
VQELASNGSRRLMQVAKSCRRGLSVVDAFDDAYATRRITIVKSMGAVVAVSIVAVLALALESSSALGSGVREFPLHRFPLAEGLPTKEFVALGGGETSKSRWMAFAYRAPHSKRPDRLCLQIPTIWLLPPNQLGVSPGVRECGGVGPEAKEPLAAATPVRGQESALVVATGTDAAKIQLALASGERLQASVHVVRAGQASEARLSTFRYAVFRIGKAACVIQISGVQNDGSVAFETEAAPCS